MNPSLASRRRGCIVCGFAADLADVNLRLFDAEGNRHVNGVKEAVSHLRGIGISGSERAVEQRVTNHRKHTEQFLNTHAAPSAAAPALAGQVTRLGEHPAAGWVSVQQAGMNVGHEALGILASRLEQMEDKELVSVARMGLTAASKRADLEIKGHVRRAADRMRIASGLGPRREPG